MDFGGRSSLWATRGDRKNCDSRRLRCDTFLVAQEYENGWQFRQQQAKTRKRIEALNKVRRAACQIGQKNAMNTNMNRRTIGEHVQKIRHARAHLGEVFETAA